MASTPPSKTHEVSSVLRDEILSGRFRPGERLPSERDLSSRFETSRGTVREALKALEQLGITTIQPGGARVVPIEECTLNVLGPLLDLGDYPDPNLIDQSLEAGSVLVGFAVRKALESNPEATITAAREITAEMLKAETEDIQAVRGTPRLIRLFAQAGNHLVLRLIMNGLRGQVMERIHATGFPPRVDALELRAITENLDRALEARDEAAIADEMKNHLDLLRQTIAEVYTTLHNGNSREIARS
ncbi:MAG: FadR/GntR family transcriptional regulator [Gammaproteobacteria bacterium]